MFSLLLYTACATLCASLSFPWGVRWMLSLFDTGRSLLSMKTRWGSRRHMSLREEFICWIRLSSDWEDRWLHGTPDTMTVDLGKTNCAVFTASVLLHVARSNVSRECAFISAAWSSIMTWDRISWFDKGAHSCCYGFSGSGTVAVALAAKIPFIHTPAHALNIWVSDN